MECQYKGTETGDRVGLDVTECNCSVCHTQFVFKKEAYYLGHVVVNDVRVDMFEIISPPSCPNCDNIMETFAVMCANQGFDLFEKRKLQA